MIHLIVGEDHTGVGQICSMTDFSFARLLTCGLHLGKAHVHYGDCAYCALVSISFGDLLGDEHNDGTWMLLLNLGESREVRCEYYEPGNRRIKVSWGPKFDTPSGGDLLVLHFNSTRRS